MSAPRIAFMLILIFIFTFVISSFQHLSLSYLRSQVQPYYNVHDLEILSPLQSITPSPAASTKVSVSKNTESKSLLISSQTTLSTTTSTGLRQTASIATVASSSTEEPVSNHDWDDQQERIREYIQWDRPNTEHWPAWHDYDHTNYDPNRWEGMDRENAYYVENTVPQLKAHGSRAEAYLPYPAYNSQKWHENWKGRYVPCPGPDGQSYADNLEHLVRAYPTSLQNFPNASIGSASVLGLDEHVCFDRHSRYSPYRFEEPRLGEPSERYSHSRRDPRWGRTGWGHLQDVCLELNQHRYKPEARVPMSLQPTQYVVGEPRQGSSDQKLNDKKKYHSRTAVLIRTWEGYKYRENDLQALRSLITELSLISGGEYQVYLLVNVKQREADIYEDSTVYERILRRTVPAEFRDIAVLWTERVLENWYPKVGDWQVYWMQFMPLQWFSKTHPEFDYIWNWETDSRYIGNHYHFLEQIATFARNMPRKHLWERNSRFYIPEQHGSWESFLNDTDASILQAKQEGTLSPVWGPQPYAPFQFPTGPDPPTSQEQDDFTWGIDEEADLITLQPIWDPSQTEWSFRDHIWNFIPTVRPIFTPDNGNGDGIYHPGFRTIPRRVFINTQSRLSKRLLEAMHQENLEGRSMQAEMWPATVALQHGLKAVYAPHPIWTDRKWPSWYMDAVFNANDNHTARWGQQSDSPYNHEREANFGGWSWYYRSVLPHRLYRRWLGWRAHDWGWDADQAKHDEKKRVVELGLAGREEEIGDVDVAGRMCLPGMLLHPVKDVREDADGG